MTRFPSRSFTRRSPAQIRKLAERAFRTRMEAPSLRHPQAGEVPLSAAEISHGVRAGLIRAEVQ